MRKILLVEDEPILREVFAEGLTRAGYDVSAAQDGAEARRFFNNSLLPELLIVDIKLPDESGVRLLEDFRKIIPGIKVIVTTAYELFQSEYEIWSADISAYMVKPIDMDDLIARVKEIIPIKPI